MKSIAFLFNSAPHGSSYGREGLDAVLSISSIFNNIAIFFVGDGIFHLIKNQNPEIICLHNYIKTFSALFLYGINKYYICSESIKKIGLNKKNIKLLNDKILNNAKILKPLKTSIELNKFSFILRF